MTKIKVDVFVNFGGLFKRKHKFRQLPPEHPGPEGEIFALLPKGNQRIRAVWAICREEKSARFFAGPEENKPTEQTNHKIFNLYADRFGKRRTICSF